MRNKIIAVNAVIVLILGLLSFVIVRQSVLGAATSPTQLAANAKFDVQGAAARFQFDALRAERFVAARALDPQVKDALSRATAGARGDSATAVCDSVLANAKQLFPGSAPSLVMIVDGNGRIVGRNGSSLSRGDDISAAYPALKQALAKSASGADIWANKERGEQFLTVYGPVRDDGKHALVMGIPLNDELSQVSEATTGRGVVLLVSAGDELRLAANSSNATDDIKAAVDQSRAGAKGALASGQVLAAQVGERFVAAAPLDNIADGKRAMIVAVSPASLIDAPQNLALPILGVMLLGLILVGAAGWFLGGYVSDPISQLEEGLLAVLNGQTDRRFELDHAELGGLAFRINQLLNQLMGIEEDTTDEQGRISKAPSAAAFNDAMNVGPQAQESSPQLDANQVAALAAEPEAQYYARLYSEYITAKKSLGEQVDHITDATFQGRIQGMEQDAQQKHGRPVRYQVHVNGREVVLLAVPL